MVTVTVTVNTPSTATVTVIVTFAVTIVMTVAVAVVVIIDDAYSPERSAIDLQLLVITVVRKKFFERRIFPEGLPFSSTQCDRML